MVRTVLGDLGRVLVLSSDPLLRTQKITLTPADGFVLSRVDGSSSARDVMALVPLPSDDVERSLFSLLCTGIVDYRRETTSASRAAIAHGRASRGASEPAADGRRPRAHSVRAGDAPAASRRERRRRRRSPQRDHADAAPGAQRRGAALADPEAARPAEARPLRGAGTRALGDRGGGARGLRRLRAHPAPGRVPRSGARGPRARSGRRCSSGCPRRTRRCATRLRGRATSAPSSPRSCAPRGPRRRGRSPRHRLRSPAGTSAAAAPRRRSAAGSRAAPRRARSREPATAPPPPEPARAHLRREAAAGEHPGDGREHVQGRGVLGGDPAARADDPARDRTRRARARSCCWRRPTSRTRSGRGAPRACSRTLLDEEPRHVAAQLQLAEIYRATGLSSRARAAYEKVLEIDPRHVQARKALEALEPKDAAGTPVGPGVALPPPLIRVSARDARQRARRPRLVCEPWAACRRPPPRRPRPRDGRRRSRRAARSRPPSAAGLP